MRRTDFRADGARSIRTRGTTQQSRRADNGELVCYIGETIRRYESEDLRLTRVYDLSFFTIGFYLNDGATYRLIESKDGEFQEKFLGNHEIETCLSRITGTEGPFRIERGI